MVEKYPIVTTEEFQAQFLLLQAKLKSYLFRITASLQDAEDLAQDTYLKAARNLASFAGKSALKTWVQTAINSLKGRYTIISLPKTLLGVVTHPFNFAADPSYVYRFSQRKEFL